MSWPDLERLARAYLDTQLAARVVTVLPGDLEQELPLVRVTRGPGSDDGITDAPLLDVEAFTAADDADGNSLGRGPMWELAEQTRQALHRLAGKAVDGALVDTVATASGPTWVDYGNPHVHRAVASYRINLRQTAASL